MCTQQVFKLRADTHVTELLVDFACLDVHLHVGEANPLMQILAVVDSTDGGLSVAGRQDLQHVWWNMVLGLGLLIVLLVQTLQKMDHRFYLKFSVLAFGSKYVTQ